MRVTAPLPSTPRLEMRRRLAVAWQDPVTRASEPVGVVVTDGDSHPFRDLRRARHFGGCRRCSALATGNARTIPGAVWPLRPAQSTARPPCRSACLGRLGFEAPLSHGMFLPAHRVCGGRGYWWGSELEIEGGGAPRAVFFVRRLRLRLRHRVAQDAGVKECLHRRNARGPTCLLTYAFLWNCKGACRPSVVPSQAQSEQPNLRTRWR